MTQLYKLRLPVQDEAMFRYYWSRCFSWQVPPYCAALTLTASNLSFRASGPRGKVGWMVSVTICSSLQLYLPDPWGSDFRLYSPPLPLSSNTIYSLYDCDCQLKFDHHINHITKTAFFHLKNIARLRPSLTFSAAETLMHAFITSRFSVLNKLQYIQNSSTYSNPC